MSRALLGYTGFVGSTLARARDYTAVYNSKNIEEIVGKVFDTVVCAGASAAKWRANQNPAADANEIQRLMVNFSQMTARRFVLISTIDVYSDPVNVDESKAPRHEGLHPYGAHRLMLEDYVRAQFEKTVIIRLPGLFGTGLRKNLIFDFMNQNLTHQINPTGRLQWYPMRRFAADLETILDSDITLINIASEPVLTDDIRQRFFPTVPMGDAKILGPQYDMQTNVASILGGKGRYHLTAAQVFAELASYLESGQARQ